MIIDDTHYDVIVIGSGAAGGTLAGQLSQSGKRVLVLERGGAMPLADQNVADVDLFRKDRYHPGEQWFGTDGDPFSPQTIYALGGNTKIWGGVLSSSTACTVSRVLIPVNLRVNPVSRLRRNRLNRSCRNCACHWNGKVFTPITCPKAGRSQPRTPPAMPNCLVSIQPGLRPRCRCVNALGCGVCM